MIIMNNKFIKYIFFGFLLGIFGEYIIALIVSIHIGDGLFYFVLPKLAKLLGSTINATLIQTLFCGIVGVGLALVLLIWELDPQLVKRNICGYITFCIMNLMIHFCVHKTAYSTGRYLRIFITSLIVWPALAGIIYFTLGRSLIKIDYKVDDIND